MEEGVRVGEGKKLEKEETQKEERKREGGEIDR